MDNNKILENLKEIIPEEKIKQNEPMNKHTSFKVGGPAEFFVRISTVEELKQVIEFTQKNNIKTTIIGNGSNILVLDKGINGIVIKVDLKNIRIEEIDDKVNIEVESGVLLGALAQRLLKEEIKGFEELSGIPGTIGGAVVMNAGAHGKEIKDILISVTALDYEGNIHTFNNKDMNFSYRHSKFSDGEYIVLSTTLQLEKGKQEEIKEKMQEYAKYRKEKQPIEFASAGSTFKRGEDFITAKLIDEAGLKGYRIGDAEVSTKHAGFVINKGEATAQDILDLIEYIKKKVYEKFEKEINLEIKIIE